MDLSSTNLKSSLTPVSPDSWIKNVKLHFSKPHLPQTIIPFGIPNHTIILPHFKFLTD